MRKSCVLENSSGFGLDFCSNRIYPYYMSREGNKDAPLFWDARSGRMRYIPGHEPKIEHDRCTDEQLEPVVFEDDEDPFAIDFT